MNNEQTAEGIKILRIVLGVAAGIVVMVLVNVVFSALILKEILPQGNMGLYALVATSIGAMLSGIFCARQSKVLLCALISGAVFVAIRYILGVLLYQGSLSFGLITSCLASLVFSTLGAMLGAALRHK